MKDNPDISIEFDNCRGTIWYTND